MAGQEEELHKGLHPEVRGVVKGKNLLLLRRVLESLAFPKTEELHQHLTRGMPMFGPFPATGIFPPKDFQGQKSEEDLEGQQMGQTCPGGLNEAE